MKVALRGELGEWRSRTTFVLALSASSVGLGNLWRFSYLVGENGGGPFLLTYLLCLFLLAVPVMIAEAVVGSHGRGGPLVAIRWAADRSMRSRGWMLLGLLACVTGLLILSYYVVVAGWAVAYAWYMKSGLFAAASPSLVAEQFERLLAEPRQMVYWQSLFLLGAVAVVALGVRRGLGLVAWLTVPALIALLLVLIKFAVDTGNLVAARDFLFSVKFIDFSPQSVLVALGHAFYTLGVGVATGICYGAYAPDRVPLGRSVMAVAVFDTAIAIMVGLAVFPIVFANNMEPSMGPGLMFVSLPYAFGNVLQGELFGTLFFVIVVLAALGSAVAIMEPVVTALMQGLRIPRWGATAVVAALVWSLALVVALSFAPMESLAGWDNGRLFNRVDTFTAGFMLPLVALLLALFVGWRVRPEILRRELGRESSQFFWLWRQSLRYIAPPAILMVMLGAVIGI